MSGSCSRDRGDGGLGRELVVGVALGGDPLACRCRRRGASTSSRWAGSRARVRPGPPKACRICWSTSFEPFAAQMLLAGEAVAEVAGERCRAAR